MPMSADLMSNLKAVPPWPQERRVSKVSCLVTLAIGSVSCDNTAAVNALMLDLTCLGPAGLLLAVLLNRPMAKSCHCNSA